MHAGVEEKKAVFLPGTALPGDESWMGAGARCGDEGCSAQVPTSHLLPQSVRLAPIWVRQSAHGGSLGNRGCLLLQGSKAARLQLPSVRAVHVFSPQKFPPPGDISCLRVSRSALGPPHPRARCHPAIARSS